MGTVVTDWAAVFAADGPGARARRPVRRAPAYAGDDAGEGVALALAALQASGVSAALCRCDGHVLGLTGRAARLTSESWPWRVTEGRLDAAASGDRERLHDLLARAADGSDAEEEAQTHGDPRVTRLAVFSRAGPILLVSFGGGADLDLAAWRARFGFTAAECEIGAAVTVGRSPSEIAAARGVSVLTVRTQLKTIYQKAGVNRLSQLAARLLDAG
ncbi:helix-turn-helix transcriptional regulator [Phenylobacterium soli]|nr:helix-turn-helix transcriptional regulator [Phenylobacterium soli]